MEEAVTGCKAWPGWAVAVTAHLAHFPLLSGLQKGLAILEPFSFPEVVAVLIGS